jgi:hypothetical protein
MIELYGPYSDLDRDGASGDGDRGGERRTIKGRDRRGPYTLIARVVKAPLGLAKAGIDYILEAERVIRETRATKSPPKDK